MHEVSLCTVHTDFDDDKEDTCAWAELVNREGGEDDEVARTTEQLAAKEITVLVTNSLDDILRRAYEKVRTGVCSVVNNVLEQILLDLLRG